jgi:NhaP-type Na+/H+ or K+/H+ antiporter
MSLTAYVPVQLQAWVKILTLAFLVVGGSCGLLIPIMLYVLDLRSEGWTWQYCALFGSMVASTDAVAIVSTMKASTSPSPPIRPQ